MPRPCIHDDLKDSFLPALTAVDLLPGVFRSLLDPSQDTLTAMHTQSAECGDLSKLPRKYGHADLPDSFIQVLPAADLLPGVFRLPWADNKDALIAMLSSVTCRRGLMVCALQPWLHVFRPGLLDWLSHL